MFLRQFVGGYYDRDHGTVGDEPINLIFNAVAIIVPNLVSNFPKTVVESRFMVYRGYAELLGLGLDYLAKQIELKDILRRWIVDSIFTMGIVKTGLATSKDLVAFSDTEHVDPGQPYVETVDFDDYILDPAARRIEEASFVGHRVRVPRQMLMDSGLYRNDMIERLPAAGSNPYSRGDVASISRHEVSTEQINDLQDYVEVDEVWVPAAQAIVTMPSNAGVFDDYLRVDDYYGPDSGPFCYLSLTPPVPDNPLPIAPVAIWNDLHVMANKMAKKIMDQADRQKSVLGYKRSAADDAQEVIDAGDGEAIAMDDPTAVGTFKFGGQEQSNEAHLAQLSYWFNMVSGNTDQLGGLRTGADTATGQQILQANGSVRLEDMRDLVYSATATVQRNLAWYLHTDPLISLPLIKRTPVPAQTQMTPYGPMLVSPPQIREDQVILTPEVRAGCFLDFHFDIEQKSMSRQDPANRLQKALIFASRALPAAAMAAQTCMQMGVPFSFPKFVSRLAKEADIDWMDEVFYDPEFQMSLAAMVMKSPQIGQSKGSVAPGPTNSMPGVMQNGGASVGAGLPGENEQANQQAQATAGEAQAAYGQV
jgi:hypothetical protein